MFRLDPFQCASEILPHGEVLVAVGRGVSGEIMDKSVELNGDLGVLRMMRMISVTLVLCSSILFKCTPCCM